MAAPCTMLAMTLIFFFFVSTTTPTVQSAPTREEIAAACKLPQVKSECNTYLMDNLDARTAAVNDVPAFSMQVAAKLAREGLQYTKVTMNKHPGISKCFENCANDIDMIGKKLQGLPAEIKPGDEAPILLFYKEFKSTCGNDCLDESLIFDEEYEMRYKFDDVMAAMDIVPDLFSTNSAGREEYSSRHHPRDFIRPPTRRHTSV